MHKHYFKKAIEHFELASELGYKEKFDDEIELLMKKIKMDYNGI